MLHPIASLHVAIEGGNSVQVNAQCYRIWNTVVGTGKGVHVLSMDCLCFNINASLASCTSTLYSPCVACTFTSMWLIRPQLNGQTAERVRLCRALK
jgi:hypothetical protein